MPTINLRVPHRRPRCPSESKRERAFIAPYWVNYHVDHHLLFYVPCYNLPTVQRRLKRKGVFPQMLSAKSYFEVLRLASSKPDKAAVAA